MSDITTNHFNRILHALSDGTRIRGFVPKDDDKEEP